MSKISFNLSEEETERLDRFAREAGFDDRSALIREAIESYIGSAYDALDEVAGTLSEREAEEMRAEIERLDEESVEAQRDAAGL